MYHEQDGVNWLGSTGFYRDDLRALIDREEQKTWSTICVWATPAFAADVMSVTFKADTSYAPPTDRTYLLELTRVPEGVTGAPAVGTTWSLPLSGSTILSLPTYRSPDGTSGYQFSFTITAARPEPGDINNDGRVNALDFGAMWTCLGGPDGPVGPSCSERTYGRADMNGDTFVDLRDVAMLSVGFSPQSPAVNTYAGVVSCEACHADRNHQWSQTRHSAAIATLEATSDEDNRECLPCHTTGYDEEGGFEDLLLTPHLADVQCEVCHGPSSRHGISDGHVASVVNMDARVCGACHQSCHGMCGDYYHPHFEQWTTSKHAQALEDIADRPDYDASCLPCHSTEYRLASGTPPSADEVDLGLTCVNCHDPHSVNHDHQLREEPAVLCAGCHKLLAGPGALPDHPQSDFLQGQGGYALDGAELDGAGPFVFADLEGSCAYCHVYREVYAGPTQPANSGHSFEPNTRACRTCHVESQAIDRLESVQAEVEARTRTISRFLDPEGPDYVDPRELTGAELEAYHCAVFDYELVLEDLSGGVHNPPFARLLLSEAEQYFHIERE